MAELTPPPPYFNDRCQQNTCINLQMDNLLILNDHKLCWPSHHFLMPYEEMSGETTKKGSTCLPRM